jgi:hypothetical protein
VITDRQKSSILVVMMAMVAGMAAACAGPDSREVPPGTPPGGPSRAHEEELREYILAEQPELKSVVRFKEPLRWKYLNDYFVIMETREGPHLVELAWECKELRSHQIYNDMADRREKRGILRTNIDTIRGCRIENFYKLPASNAVEATEEAPLESASEQAQ